MKKLVMLADISSDFGGAERYWATVMPAIKTQYDVRLYARVVEGEAPLGVPAEQIAWSTENDIPSAGAAGRVSAALRGADAVITANVLDPLTLEAVRDSGARWITKVHDHRVYCPNGNKIFPQIPTLCSYTMGTACVVNSLLRGCVHGPRASSLDAIRRRMRVRDTLARADVVLVSGTYMRDLCVQNGFEVRRLNVLPPPLAEEFFEDRTEQTNEHILFAGRIEAEKGLESMVRAVGKIDSARRPAVAVAGKGSEEYERRAYETAAKFGVRMIPLGFLNQRQLRDAIDAARVFVLPSLWPEPFGIAGTQAMARARPVVAYDVGGVSGWLDGAGVAVGRGDEAAMARGIERFYHDYDAWKRASEKGAQNAERYRVAAHGEQILRLLNEG